MRETDAGAWERPAGELGRVLLAKPSPQGLGNTYTIRTCFPQMGKHIYYSDVFSPNWEKHVLFGRVFPNGENMYYSDVFSQIGKHVLFGRVFPRPLGAKFAPQAWAAPSLRPQRSSGDGRNCGPSRGVRGLRGHQRLTRPQKASASAATAGPAPL